MGDHEINKHVSKLCQLCLIVEKTKHKFITQGLCGGNQLHDFIPCSLATQS